MLNNIKRSKVYEKAIKNWHEDDSPMWLLGRNNKEWIKYAQN